MSYSRGSISYYKVSCDTFGVPVGVIIGRKGMTINLISSTSRAQVRVRDGQIQVRGGNREVIAAKALLKRLKTNYANGVIGLNIAEQTLKPRRKIIVKTNNSTGWSKLEANRAAESNDAPEPKKVAFNNKNCFSGLDFDDSSDDEESEEIVSSSTKPVENFPSLPTSQQIKLVVTEKTTPDSTWSKWVEEKKAFKISRSSKSWADICEEDDDE